MPSNEELESWLLAVASQADRPAFARLFEHYAPRIKGFMLRGGCPEPLAEEIAQETLVAVWRKASLFRPGQASVATWIFTVARNLRIDLHRRQSGLPEFTGFEFDPVEQEPAPPSERPEEQLGAAQLSQRVREAMSRLPEEQALVVRLSFFEEQPHAEIARALDLPLGTVKSRIRLAAGQLRKLLGDFR